MTPPIFFFIPPNLWPEDLPTRVNQNWTGYSLGIYAWTVQTQMYLQSIGINCTLTQQLPEAGIVFCHSQVLQSVELLSSPTRLIICIKADAPLCQNALIHVVQNPSEASPINDRYYIPHWPQPQLLGRLPSRAEQFSTIAFFGHDTSLAPELRSPAWRNALDDLGLNWRVINDTSQWNQRNRINADWNDYSEIDAVLAVRSFKPLEQRLTGYFSSKPPTKLFNAWLSGTIPILGRESAYRQVGTPGIDYVEVTSFKALIRTLSALKQDEARRRSLLTQGRLRAQEYTPAKILRKWQIFLEVVAIPAYYQWCQSSPQRRQQMLLSTRLSSQINRLSYRFRRVLLEMLIPQ